MEKWGWEWVFHKAGKTGTRTGWKLTPIPIPIPARGLISIPVPIPVGGGDFSPMRGGAPTGAGIPRPRWGPAPHWGKIPAPDGDGDRIQSPSGDGDQFSPVPASPPCAISHTGCRLIYSYIILDISTINILRQDKDVIFKEQCKHIRAKRGDVGTIREWPSFLLVSLSHIGEWVESQARNSINIAWGVLGSSKASDWARVLSNNLRSFISLWWGCWPILKIWRFSWMYILTSIGSEGMRWSIWYCWDKFKLLWINLWSFNWLWILNFN